MFCSNCGTQVNDSMKFCCNCGNSLTISTNIQDNVTISNTQDNRVTNSMQQSNTMAMVNLNINNRNNEYHYLEENRNFFKYFFLCLITFGIYNFFFWPSYIKDLNMACNDDDDSSSFLMVLFLSLITFSIYYYYWAYKQLNRISDLSEKIGGNVKETGSQVLLLAIIGTFFSIGILILDFFLIENLNRVTKKLKKY